jgi:hypothetical protein
MVQGGILVKPPQVNCPFDDFSIAAELHVSSVARNGNNAPVDIRSVLPVDCDFRLTRSMAFLQGREVHEGEANRSLDLVNIRARQAIMPLNSAASTPKSPWRICE